MRGIEEQLGLNPNRVKDSVWEKETRFLGSLSSTIAGMGLSSPTSGLKNVAIGIPRAMASFGILNTSVALARHVSRNEAISKRDLNWVKEYGSKKLVLEAQETFFEKIPGVGKYLTMESIMNINLMTRTEGVNRIVSSYAGAMYFETLLSSMRGEAPKEWWQKSFASKKEIDRALRDIWRLSESEIAFLKKNRIESNTSSWA